MIGNLMAVAMFFSVITLFVGVGLSALEPELILAAPVFAGLLATGLAVFLFPGKPAQYLLIFLRSAMHFVFILIIAFIALEPFSAHPESIACAIAGAVSGCIAIGLYLDSRELARAGAARLAQIRWSHLFFGLALLASLPLGVMVLAMSLAADDFNTQVMRAATGGGSVTGILWLGARLGLFAAARIGLGGIFGGGGAGRGE